MQAKADLLLIKETSFFKISFILTFLFRNKKFTKFCSFQKRTKETSFFKISFILTFLFRNKKFTKFCSFQKRTKETSILKLFLF